MNEEDEDMDNDYGIKKFIEMLTAGLRTEEFDRVLIACATDEGWGQCTVLSLMDIFTKKRKINPHFDKEYQQVPSWRVHRSPAQPIVELLSRIGLEDQLFVYRSRFPGPLGERMAEACEHLQAKMFDFEFRTERDETLYRRPKEKLNAFRLAQKIRNERGSGRQKPTTQCFESFEDIVGLERGLESGDEVDVILQLNRLGVINWTHLSAIFFDHSSFSHVEAVHKGMIGHEGRFLSQRLVQIFYGARFRELAAERRDSPLTWPEVKYYLKSAPYFSWEDEIFCGAEIRDEDLNEALNCVLNKISRRNDNDDDEYYYYYDEGDLTLGKAEWIPVLKKLLDRGASLYFRHPDEEQSVGRMVGH